MREIFRPVQAHRSDANVFLVALVDITSVSYDGQHEFKCGIVPAGMQKKYDYWVTRIDGHHSSYRLLNRINEMLRIEMCEWDLYIAVDSLVATFEWFHRNWRQLTFQSCVAIFGINRRV